MILEARDQLAVVVGVRLDAHTVKFQAVVREVRVADVSSLEPSDDPYDLINVGVLVRSCQ